MKETNELEQFADEYVQTQFESLYKTDLWMLARLIPNPCAYEAFLDELVVRWTVPQEERKDCYLVPCQAGTN